jgi:hypothetical protein
MIAGKSALACQQHIIAISTNKTILSIVAI